MKQYVAPDIVSWVSLNVLPHEAELRMKLSLVCKDAAEIDDVLQEVYCRLLKLESVEQIWEPRGYVMRMAKNIVIDQFRHNTVVEIDAMANLEELDVPDPAPTPERIAMARAELQWVMGLIAGLPERCRRVIRARRIDGLSQDDTARSLGLTKSVVEKETMRGMALISEHIERAGIQYAGDAPKAKPVALVKPLNKKRHV